MPCWITSSPGGSPGGCRRTAPLSRPVYSRAACRAAFLRGWEGTVFLRSAVSFSAYPSVFMVY